MTVLGCVFTRSMQRQLINSTSTASPATDIFPRCNLRLIVTSHVRSPFHADSRHEPQCAYTGGEEAFRGRSPPAIALKTGRRKRGFLVIYTRHSKSVPSQGQQGLEGILTSSAERYCERSRNAFIWCEQVVALTAFSHSTVTNFAKFRVFPASNFRASMAYIFEGSGRRRRASTNC